MSSNYVFKPTAEISSFVSCHCSRGGGLTRRYAPMEDLEQLEFPLIGERVVVRPLEADDTTALYVIDSDAEVKKYLGGPVTEPEEAWVASMSRLCPSLCALAVCEKSTAQFMGRASLNPVAPFCSVVELRIVLGKDWWHQGFGPEIASLLVNAAFGQMRASSVEAIAHPDNHGSMSILRGLNFHQEGVVSCAGWQDGHVRHSLAEPARNGVAA